MISVIIPLFNEQESVVAMHEALVSTLRSQKATFEILFVDDGSRDRTASLLRELFWKDPHVKVIRLARNFGQTAAMAAGIKHARGDVVVTIDGDLQNDPKDIPLIVEKIEEGYDIVVGWRRRRKDPLFTRVLPSIIANWLISRITGIQIRDNGCSLKGFTSTLIQRIPLYNELHRFIPAMTSLAGARIAQVEVRHHPRRFGISKYGLSRTYKVLIDLVMVQAILAFSQKPAAWGLAGAGIAFMLSVALAGASLIGDLKGSVIVMGLSLLFASLSLFLGGQALLALLIFQVERQEIEDYSTILVRAVDRRSR